MRFYNSTDTCILTSLQGTLSGVTENKFDTEKIPYAQLTMLK